MTRPITATINAAAIIPAQKPTKLRGNAAVSV